MLEELPQGCTLVDKYRILSSIGRGAWSRVYLARDLGGVGQFCAIKAMAASNLSREDADAVTRSFLQEAAILRELSHEGLPRIYDRFAVNGAHYLAMEWIAGQTLLEHLKARDDPPRTVEIVGWGVELCKILAYLHAQHPNPVVVGDLKPSNIMRTFEGRLKIVDFGVARYARPVRGAGRVDSKTGGSLGSYTFVTPGFSPPEQYESGAIDARSDIYALGATLYFLLTGQELDRFRFQIPPLRRYAPSASRQLEEILTKCLQPNPNLRFSDASVLRRALAGAAEAEDPRGDAQLRARDILSSLYQSKKGGIQI